MTLEEAKENMINKNYGIKKETFTISDSFNEISFNISYPIIYSIKENTIEYEKNISNSILNLIIADTYEINISDVATENYEDLFYKGINLLENIERTSFDYEIAYVDDNFLTIDYTWNRYYLQGHHRYYVSPLTINLYLGENSEIDIIKRKDIINDEEILEKIKNEAYKEVGGIYEVIKPLTEALINDEEFPSGYYLTDNFLLKDNNKLQLVIYVPAGKGDIAIIEIDYNWKEKLES